VEEWLVFGEHGSNLGASHCCFISSFSDTKDPSTYEVIKANSVTIIITSIQHNSVLKNPFVIDERMYIYMKIKRDQGIYPRIAKKKGVSGPEP
jgi:hypothetical protein